MRISQEIQIKQTRLLDCLRDYGSCAIAFSAGLDSTVLTKAAALALDDQAVALTADSPSMPSGQVDAAIELARLIGIRHEVIETDELADAQYQANTPERCYFCKQIIFRRLLDRARQLGLAVVIDGTHADDQNDYRPGIRALRELGVQSPLVECGLGKGELRELARRWQLPVHDRPASPCLATRIAYGIPITRDRLTMIDRAEQFFHERGFPIVRVRLHEGGIARVEVPLEDLPRLVETNMRQAVTSHLRKCRFRYATIDLEGFRSGSMNLSME